jgi:hypothetical protein
MTTEKFSVAVAFRGPAPDVKDEPADATSGSVNAAAPIKLFKAIDMFMFLFLC